MNIGDRIRVKSHVLVYHHPDHRNEAFDIYGLEGVLTAVLLDWNGRPVSANYPYQVQFERKFKAHLQDSELEVLAFSEEVA
ncbi:MAG: ferredoxin-thioredoxin reductase variable chain [Cyanobacteriota bacterium]|nr:ferredoxin-thioredoxin reductase variable chain [Cyanobacteriota bacterium]